jgi:hypothetical protein
MAGAAAAAAESNSFAERREAVARHRDELHAVDAHTNARERSRDGEWYATAATLDTGATGRAEDDPATSSNNAWTAPPTAGTAFLWIVLRDSRGGVDYSSAQRTRESGCCSSPLRSRSRARALVQPPRLTSRMFLS